MKTNPVKTVDVSFVTGQSRIGFGNSMVVTLTGQDGSQVSWLIDPGAGVAANGKLITPRVLKEMVERMNVNLVIATHAHLDHVGGLPDILDKPLAIVASYWTGYFLNAHLSENGFAKFAPNARFTYAPQPTFSQYSENSGWFDAGLDGSDATFAMFPVAHSTPEARGLVVFHVPGFGSYVWMIDMTEPDTPAEKERLAQTMSQIASLEGGVQAVFVDSTSAHANGSSPTELEVRTAICEQIEKTKKVVYFTCFSGDVYRIKAAAQEAVKAGRRFAFVAGRSFLQSMVLALTSLNEEGEPYLGGTIETTREGDLRITSLEGLEVVGIKEAVRLSKEAPNSLICFLPGTQAQGWDQEFDEEEFGIASALVRLVQGGLSDRSGNFILKIQKGDTIIFSSSVIPDSASEVETLKAAIANQGGRVIDSINSLVHMSGHGFMGDYIAFLDPKTVVPIHGDAATREKMGQRLQTVLPTPQILLVSDGQQVNWSITEVGQVEHAVADIPDFPKESESRIQFWGSRVVVLRVWLNRQGEVETLLFEPRDDLHFSIALADRSLKYRLGASIIGFLAEKAEWAKEDESVFYLRERINYRELCRQVKEKVMNFLSQQKDLESVPFPSVVAAVFNQKLVSDY